MCDIEKTNEENKVVETAENQVQPIDQLLQDIQNSSDKAELEKLYQQFNISNTKKNVFRVNELNNLLDMVNAQARARFEKNPNEISNKEILDYMSAIQNQLDRSQKVVDGIKDINNVQVNNTQNNININVNDTTETVSLNRDSRQKILDFINNIMNTSADIIDAEVVEGDNENDK